MSIVPSNEINPEDYKDFQDQELNYVSKKTTILDKDDEWYYGDQTFVSNSHLKIIGSKGPQHLLQYFMYGSEDKADFQFGRAAHMMVLQPELFDKTYLCLDDIQVKEEIGGARPTTTNKYKEWLEDIQVQANLDGKELITINDYTTIKQMVEVLKTIPEIQALLQGTLREKIFTNTIAEVPCKIKVDAINTTNYIIDYKTTKDAANKKNFTKEVWNYDYDQQAAFYCDVASVERFIFIVQEKSFPYSVVIAEVSEDTMTRGRAKYQSSLLTYKKYFVDKDPTKTLLNYYQKISI